MDIKELKSAYTMRDMVKMFRQIDELTREKSTLAKELAGVRAELELVKQENIDLITQLNDMQGDLVRQMTSPRILSMSHQHEC